MKGPGGDIRRRFGEPFRMVNILEGLIGTASALDLALFAGAALLAGFLRGFVGFGGALVVIMVLATIFGPRDAVAIAALSGLPSMFQLLPNAARFSDRAFVIPFGLAVFAAAPIGTLVLVAVAPELMRMTISGFVLVMVAMLHRNWQPPGAAGMAAALGTGIAAGLVQGSAGVGGPLAVAIALSRPGTAQQQRANVLGALVSLSLCSLVPLWYHGLFTRQVVVASLLLVPLYSGATWFGARYFSRGGHRYFRNAALLTLAGIGIVTLTLAIRDYMAEQP